MAMRRITPVNLGPTAPVPDSATPAPAPTLGPKAEAPPRVKNKSKTKRSKKRPSELLKERMDAEDKRKSLGESLTQAAMAMPPGEGPAGKALKAGLSGAAAGATIGEALSQWYEERRQRGTPSKPRTVSEQAM